MFSEWPMSHKMEENSNWVLEVEEALLDEAPPERIRILLAGESHPSILFVSNTQAALFLYPFVLMSGPTAWRYRKGNPALKSLTMFMTIPNNQPYTRSRKVLFHF